MEAIHGAVESDRRFVLVHGRVIRLFSSLMLEALGRKQELAASLAQIHARLRTLDARWMSRLFVVGELRADTQTEAAATVVIGALGGVAYQRLLELAEMKREPIYANLAATLERGLTPVDADP